ncbi:MAG: group 1 truncated hemoglobin [Saprospiraceae bacterium]|nr:group 1 truncated hemoglobin [Saprospiraceae bacterium]
MTKFKLIALLMLFALGFSACDNDDDDGMQVESLYSKLGGTTMVEDPTDPGNMIEQGRLGLRSVVDSTIFVIAADPDLSPFFAPLLMELGNGNTNNLAVLSKNLTDFFCVATGAENFAYNGLNMRDAHDPAQNPRMAMKSSDQDFDNFVGAVVTGATQNNVPTELIQEVGELLETLRSDVVQQ